MAYIGKSPTGTGVRSRFYYTQTSGGGTSISGTDDNSKTLTFTDGEYIDVFLNGVLLVAGTDYNTNTANTISGLAALANGDVVEVVVYDIFTVADTVSASQGGTFNAGVTMSDGLTVDDDGAAPLTVDRATSDGTIIDVQKDGSSIGSLSAIGGDLTIQSTSSSHAGLRFGSSTIFPTNNAGSINNNTIDLGYSGYAFKDLYLGGNLYIGGTGSANALDDYETGTWTPTIGATNETSSGGEYVKVGDLVFIRGQMIVTTLGSGSGSEISGLPFTPYTSNMGITVAYYNGIATNTYELHGNVRSNSKIRMEGKTSFGTGQASGMTTFKNGASVYFSGCYRVS